MSARLVCLFQELPHGESFWLSDAAGCSGGVLELGLSPTRWHCVHAVQAELLLLFLPPKLITSAVLAALASHPPSSGREDGDAEECPSPEPFPQPHVLRIQCPWKEEKN